jgi:hypothetical protein
VSAIYHNTLAASEYGLLDPTTFAPRPNYWAALLWRRLMGTTVLDAAPPRPGCTCMGIVCADVRIRRIPRVRFRASGVVSVYVTSAWQGRPRLA